MNDIVPFAFDENPVRAVLLGDAPWFVANDVAKVLGYTQAPNMCRMLDEDEKGLHIVNTLGGEQSLTIVSESGLFAAILKSRRSEAKRFRRWVTGEVLPALRKNGHYAMPGSEPPPAETNIMDMEPGRVMAAVTVVREARRLFGPMGARSVWAKVGLPTPIADARISAVDDLATALAAFMESREFSTTEEAARGVGYSNPDYRLRERVAETLRLLGFEYRQARRGGVKARYWMRPVPEAMCDDSEAAEA